MCVSYCLGISLSADASNHEVIRSFEQGSRLDKGTAATSCSPTFERPRMCAFTRSSAPSARPLCQSQPTKASVDLDAALSRPSFDAGEPGGSIPLVPRQHLKPSRVSTIVSSWVRSRRSIQSASEEQEAPRPPTRGACGGPGAGHGSA